MANHLTDEAVSRYRQQGFVYPVPCLAPGEAARYRDALEDYERSSGQKSTLAIRGKGHLKMRLLYDLVHDPRILDAVESVLGPNILCWGSSLFVKEPNDPAFVAWHQDSFYWGLEPDDVVSAWVAFAPSTIANGAMQVIPGSHREQRLPHGKSPAGSTNMISSSEEIAVEVDEGQGVSLLLDEGEMSLHHVNIVHGSPPNRSDARRYGFAIRYVGAHVRQSGDRATAILVRGRDDYGYFSPDPVPKGDFDPEIMALHPNLAPA